MLSKGFYLTSIVCSNILVLFLKSTVLPSEKTDATATVTLTTPLILAIAAGIFVTVISCILMYKAWFAIQDGHARTTPGKAIGFMFIPFFNLYWTFQLYWGFSIDYNLYLDRYKVNSPKLPVRLFLTYCFLNFFVFLQLIGNLEYIALSASVMSAVIFILMVIKICDAVNALYFAGDQMAMQTVQSTESQDLPAE